MNRFTCMLLNQKSTRKCDLIRIAVEGGFRRHELSEIQKYTPIVPVLIPDLTGVRAFAQELYQRNKDWQGLAFGWEAEYHASRQEKPQYSRIKFTPAEFWIGDATIWGLAMMWEAGDGDPPSESISDWNVIKKFRKSKSNNKRLPSR